MLLNHSNPFAEIFLNGDAEQMPSNPTTIGPANHIAGSYQAAFEAMGLTYAFHSRPNGKNLLSPAIRVLSSLKRHSLSVVCQGYGVHAASLLSSSRVGKSVVLHTWKVPFTGPSRIRSKINDLSLERVVKAARLVVVVSKEQQRWISEKYPHVATVWLPVVADTTWWNPGGAETEILRKLSLEDCKYLLCVGDIDRDEKVAIQLSMKLRIPLVRVTRDARTAERAEQAASLLGAGDFHCLQRIPYMELRDLHRRAWALLNAPTVTYHPAGLTTLTESMACGGVVLFPKGPTSEGYVTHGKDAILYDEMTLDSVLGACQPLLDEGKRLEVSAAARRRCETFLNFQNAGALFAQALRNRDSNLPPAGL